MKKFGAFVVGALISINLLTPLQAEPLARKSAYLFNFDPSTLFIAIPAFAMGNGFGLSESSNKVSGANFRIKQPTNDSTDPSLNVANLTQQEFAQGFVNSLLASAQPNQMNQARVVEIESSPFFFTAFFKNLGIDSSQLPFFKLLTLGNSARFQGDFESKKSNNDFLLMNRSDMKMRIDNTEEATHQE